MIRAEFPLTLHIHCHSLDVPLNSQSIVQQICVTNRKESKNTLSLELEQFSWPLKNFLILRQIVFIIHILHSSARNSLLPLTRFEWFSFINLLIIFLPLSSSFHIHIYFIIHTARHFQPIRFEVIVTGLCTNYFQPLTTRDLVQAFLLSRNLWASFCQSTFCFDPWLYKGFARFVIASDRICFSICFRRKPRDLKTKWPKWRSY